MGRFIYMYMYSLVPRPSHIAFFAAVEKSVQKAWVRGQQIHCVSSSCNSEITKHEARTFVPDSSPIFVVPFHIMKLLILYFNSD